MLETHRADLNSELCASLLSLGDEAQDKADYRKAVAIYTISKKAAELIENNAAIADSFNRLAVAYKSLGAPSAKKSATNERHRCWIRWR